MQTKSRHYPVPEQAVTTVRIPYPMQAKIFRQAAANGRSFSAETRALLERGLELGATLQLLRAE